MIEWHDTSSFVAVLSIPDESFLRARFAKLPSHAARALFTEADLDDEATAFAVLGADAGRQLSDLPLALREEVVTV